MALSTPRRVLAGVTLAGVIGVGGLGVAALNPLGVAGAQDATTAQAPSTDRPKKGEVLDEVLAGLVADGTIDQAQSDKIAAAFKDKAAALRDQFGDHQDRKDRRAERRGAGLTTAAQALGITEDELKAALKDGQTIAEVADAEGVDVQVVIDALIAEGNQRIDAAVADGRIDAEKAAELKAKLAEQVQKRITTPREERVRPGG